MNSTAGRELLRAAKPRLVLHDDPALNAETPAQDLDEPLTPLPSFFVRNNGALPERPSYDPETWRLTVDGQVTQSLQLTVADLQRDFEVVEVTAVLECAGNGRAGFSPPTDGLQWGLGAVGCATWRGVRMADVLGAAGTLPGAAYVAHHSPDRAEDGTDGPAISRGLPFDKALAPETLLAFAMNGQPLPYLHGAPLRVVAPGYPGSAWQKWLERLTVLDREHDGIKMTGTDYRLPRTPVVPDQPWDQVVFDVITDMGVRALVTAPADGFVHDAAQPLAVRGFAWGGHAPAVRVEVSLDGGGEWQEAVLEPGPEGMPFAWRRFRAEVVSGTPGQLEIIARATDLLGRSQPLGSAPWNPRGYCNNGVQRVRGTIRT